MLHGGQASPVPMVRPLKPDDQGDLVALAAVPVRAGQRLDRAGVVEEGLRVADRGAEPELERDVGPAVPVVVDVDLVQHVVAELVEVRASGRPLQRNVVGDQRDRVRFVRAHERVYVGTVGHRVLGYLRCLAMRRHAITSQAGKGARTVSGTARGWLRRVGRRARLPGGAGSADRPGDPGGEVLVAQPGLAGPGEHLDVSRPGVAHVNHDRPGVRVVAVVRGRRAAGARWRWRPGLAPRRPWP